MKQRKQSRARPRPSFAAGQIVELMCWIPPIREGAAVTVTGHYRRSGEFYYQVRMGSAEVECVESDLRAFEGRNP